MKKLRVLVADDHPTFREGLCHFLEKEPDIEIVGQSADGEETIRLARELIPDVAIIDIAMPKVSGIEAARQIKETCPTVAILMVSAYDYESYLAGALEAGAAGYLLKNAPVSELISAVRLVHSEEAVFNLKSIRKMFHTIGGKSPKGKPAPNLHAREVEVLKRIAKGLSNKQIAVELGISQRTVQTHISNIFRKLEVRSRTEAVLRALQQGWFAGNGVS
ncbi:MAG: response regulator transcription factor [Chloroflexi bacterium]|nr:response regulator transcription factor [Chloroflexota bacterium]